MLCAKRKKEQTSKRNKKLSARQHQTTILLFPTMATITSFLISSLFYDNVRRIYLKISGWRLWNGHWKKLNKKNDELCIKLFEKFNCRWRLPLRTVFIFSTSFLSRSWDFCHLHWLKINIFLRKIEPRKLSLRKDSIQLSIAHVTDLRQTAMM